MNISQSQNPLDAQARRVADLMYGYNYQVSLGVAVFAEAHTLATVQQSIKLAFEDTKPTDARYSVSTKAAMTAELQECFAYRGDETAGLRLTQAQAATLRAAQDELLAALSTHMHADSTIMESNLEHGLPVYYVYWRFAYVIINPTAASLLVYGAASD